LRGQQSVLLMNDDFEPCAIWHKTYKTHADGQQRETELVHKAEH